MIDAVVAGHLCLDIIPQFISTAGEPESAPDAVDAPATLLSPGRLVEVGEALLSTGGAVSNTGIALYRLGLDVRLVARVGDDPLSDLIRRALARQGPGLSDHLTTAAGEPSSYTIVINPPGVDRGFLHCPGTNATFGAADVPEALLAEARLLHLGYPPIMRRMYLDAGAELVALMARARSAGATTSLDMSLPDPSSESGRQNWRALLANVLPHVDLFLPSAEELLFMLDRPRYRTLSALPGGVVESLEAQDLTRLADESLHMGARLVALKVGHRGLYLRTSPDRSVQGRARPPSTDAWADRELWVPCFRVEVVGTVGSGDATIAGLLTGLLHGLSPEACVTAAVAVGACNVEAADATSGVRPWSETLQRVARGWNRLEMRPPREVGWRWAEPEGLWHGPHDGAR